MKGTESKREELEPMPGGFTFVAFLKMFFSSLDYSACNRFVLH